jgi:hypothetical protein
MDKHDLPIMSSFYATHNSEILPVAHNFETVVSFRQSVWTECVCCNNIPSFICRKLENPSCSQNARQTPVAREEWDPAILHTAFFLGGGVVGHSGCYRTQRRILQHISTPLHPPPPTVMPHATLTQVIHQCIYSATHHTEDEVCNVVNINSTIQFFIWSFPLL